jgi:hypothetical protein
MDPQLIAAPGHTQKMFDPKDFQRLVESVVQRVRDIQEKHPEVQALAACGHSGLMLMGAVSYLTGLPQIAVRKTKDTYHDHRTANGWMGCRGYLIIDDLISSGSTIDKIIAGIEREFAKERSDNPGVFEDLECPKPVAILLYEQYSTYRYNVVSQGKLLTLRQYVTQRPVSEWTSSYDQETLAASSFRIAQEDVEEKPQGRYGNGWKTKEATKLPDIDPDKGPGIFAGQDLTTMFAMPKPRKNVVIMDLTTPDSDDNAILPPPQTFGTDWF